MDILPFGVEPGGDKDSDSEIADEVGEEVERVGMAKEDDFVRKIADPNLPTPEEID